MARLWLFDLDGTLVDSEKAIKACYLKVGQDLVPERCKFIETMVIGPTLDESTRMILTDENNNLIDEFKERFKELYDEKFIFTTPEYKHSGSTLNKLYEKGDDLWIVTNKRSYPTKKLINYYGWKHLFKLISCMDENPSLKNKFELIVNKNINTNNYSNIYFIGDTVKDGITANNLNYKFIKAEYGYGTNENWKGIKIFKKIDCISKILEF